MHSGSTRIRVGCYCCISLTVFLRPSIEILHLRPTFLHLFKSSEKHGCDLIVAATFDIKISDDGVVINLIGYPANFANWSSATTADFNWINLERADRNIGLDTDKKDSENKKK